ncbi:hypothetical protein IMZ48_38665 [Candidatus Bathyarchaeota archaeon]|nr:hypothetical protein [Candidatus Bathyarchaeota archaeon]
MPPIAILHRPRSGIQSIQAGLLALVKDVVDVGGQEPALDVVDVVAAVVAEPDAGAAVARDAPAVAVVGAADLAVRRVRSWR